MLEICYTGIDFKVSVLESNDETLNITIVQMESDWNQQVESLNNSLNEQEVEFKSDLEGMYSRYLFKCDRYL